jgi:hypothetical protein
LFVFWYNYCVAVNEIGFKELISDLNFQKQKLLEIKCFEDQVRY